MTALPGMTAEEYAAGMIRRALDSAVVPDLRLIADESALTLREVEAVRDRILSGKRGTQTLGRPHAAHAPASPPRATAVPLVGPVEPDDEQLIARAIGHQSAKVRALAKRCHDANVKLGLLLDDLRAAMDAHEEAAAEAARKAKRIAKLEAELAELRGKPLPGKRRESEPNVPFNCPRCPRGFVKRGWLDQHVRAVHGEAS